MSVKSEDYHSPFTIPRNSKSLISVIMIVYLIFFLLLCLVFKPELNPFGDEIGYHDGGVTLKVAIEQGDFFNSAGDRFLFKYPGYYSLIGITYYFFGERPIIIRLINLLCLFLCAICLANSVCIFTGNRGFVLTFLITIFNPLYIRSASVIYRDIWTLLLTIIIFYSVAWGCFYGVKWKELASLRNILVYILLYLFRAPQCFFMAVSHAFILMFTIRISRKNRILLIGISFLLAYVTSGWWMDSITEMMNQALFGEKQENVLSISVTSGDDIRDINTVQDAYSVIFNPIVLLRIILIKASHFFLGFLPFPTHETDNWTNLLSLWGESGAPTAFSSDQLDIVLQLGLYWIYMLMALPFYLSGIVYIYKKCIPFFIYYTLIFASYVIIIFLFQGDHRWGLTLNAMGTMVTSLGVFFCGKQILQRYFSFFTISLLIICFTEFFQKQILLLTIVPANLLILLIYMYSGLIVSDRRNKTRQSGFLGDRHNTRSNSIRRFC